MVERLLVNGWKLGDEWLLSMMTSKKHMIISKKCLETGWLMIIIHNNF